MSEAMQPITLDQLTPPYVTVVVPVCNEGEHLRRCLDSLVYQTLQNIEIIVVNDGSQDDSQAIIDEYVARYPGKVTSIRHEKNLGAKRARKTGLTAARAPYVLFTDGDDFLNSITCEHALNHILAGGHDLIGINVVQWDNNGKKHPHRTRPTCCDKATLIRTDTGFICEYLFRTEFLRATDFFSIVPFEDSCALPWLLMQADSIGWMSKGTHYYYTQHENALMTGVFSQRRIDDCLGTDAFLWSKVKPGCESPLADHIALHMARAIRQYPSMRVQAVRHIQNLFPQLEPWLTEETTADTRTTLQKIMEFPAEPVIPAVLYYNGFRGAVRNEAVARRASSLFPDWQCASLNESTCDLASAPAFIRQAYDEGRLEDVAVYFAMERIVRDGGMYAAPYTHLLDGAPATRYDQAFFPAGKKNSVSLHFFGGAAGNDVMKRILRAWDGSALQECVANILFAQFNVHLRGDEEFGLHGVHILPAERCVIPEANNFCYINAAETDDVIAQPMELYLGALQGKQDALLADARKHQKSAQTLASIREQRDNFKEQRDAAKKERNRLKADVSKLRKELNKLRKEREKLKRERNAQAALAGRYNSLLRFSLVGWAYKLYRRIKK